MCMYTYTYTYTLSPARDSVFRRDTEVRWEEEGGREVTIISQRETENDGRVRGVD